MSTIVFWVLLISSIGGSGARGIAERHGIPFEAVDGAVFLGTSFGAFSFFFQTGVVVTWGTSLEPILWGISSLFAVLALLCLFPIAEYLFGEDE